MTAPTLGKYRLLGELGRGGMATVYLAAAEGPSRFTKLVVVKQLKAELAEEYEFREMFLDEARLAARLNHPNIVQTYEVMDGDGKYMLVMEYLEGQPLSNVRSRLIRKGALSVDSHVRVLAEVLEGLHAAHEAVDWDGTPLNVVHRDVSPHNVFVTFDGQVKVVDFGVAKAATSSQKTQTGVIKGKISYMAPEQALGRKVDRRADIFAVGIMLWEAVAGRRMWKDLPDAGIIHYLAMGELPKLTEFAPDAPPALVEVCARALAPKPDDRFSTAAAMRAPIDAYLATLDPPPQLRPVGTAVAEHFAEERARIRAVIERQLSRGPLMVTGELAPLDLPQLPTADASLPTGGPQPSLVASAAAPVVGVTLAGQERSSTPGTGLSMASATGPEVHGAPPPSRNIALVISTSATALGLLSLAIVLVWRATQATAPAPPPAATLVSPPSATALPVALASAPSASALASASAAPTASASPTKGAHTNAAGHPKAAPSSPVPAVKPPATGDIILQR
ncbi:MAG: serine/threonine protein kinase [Myxococcales bacterium]|nr:serine/threonine protein kinase [Myxococcales bacterium]